MSTGEVLQVIGVGLVALVVLAGAWVLGYVHAESKLEGQYMNRLTKLNELERLRRAARDARPCTACGQTVCPTCGSCECVGGHDPECARAAARPTVAVNPDETRQIRIPPYMRQGRNTPHRRNHRRWEEENRA